MKRIKAFEADARPVFNNPPNSDFPNFSHKLICTGKFCIKKCSVEQFKSLSDKLRILSTLTWQQIDTSPRTTNGYEQIPRDSLKTSIPDDVPDNVPIIVFRFGGGKRGGRMAGYKSNSTFNILFIDTVLKLYDHGS